MAQFAKVYVAIYAASFICIILGLYEYFENWPLIWDISLWDESIYMDRGIRNWDVSQMKNYEASPLYSWVYSAVSGLHWPPEKLTMLVGLIVVVACVLALYIAVLVVSKSFFLATILICGFVLSGLTMIEPRLVYAALFMLSIGSAFAYSARIYPLKAIVLTLTAYLVCFIRPEFCLAFYALSGVTVLSILFMVVSADKFKIMLVEEPSSLIATILCLVVLVVLINLWSFPVLVGGERAMMAFGQHYAGYWTYVNKPDTMAFMDWESVVAKEFPGAKSQFGAALINPGEMLGFIGENVRVLLGEIGGALSKILFGFRVFGVLLVAGFSLSLLRLNKAKKADVKVFLWANVDRVLAYDVLLWVALASPVLLSVIIIYPRLHYLVILFGLVFIFIAIFVRRLNGFSIPLSSLIVAIGFILSAKPYPVIAHPMINILNGLRANNISGLVLEQDGGWCFFMGRQCTTRWAQDIPRGTSFLSYLDDQSIDAVVVTKTMIAYAKAWGQSDFVAFLDSHGEGRWVKHQLSPDVFVLQRKPS